VIILLSPAKTLDFESSFPELNFTTPVFQKDAVELVKTITSMGKSGLQTLMKLSDKLSELNDQRFAQFREKPKDIHVRPAIFAFNGDVYEGLNIKSFSKEEIYYAQENLRVLSGLYGLLKPLDVIQPYRLEMGTKLNNSRGNNLYKWWGQKLSNQLNKELKKHPSQSIINLASEEYFKSVKKDLKVNHVSPIFQDYVSGEYKTVGIYAKKARGLMAAFILKNKIDKLYFLKDFNCEGYKFEFEESSEKKLFFRRKR
jgi:cytoplasmic iron level regulating protein YaaA (DUF328/UPF0246 family)